MNAIDDFANNDRDAMHLDFEEEWTAWQKLFTDLAKAYPPPSAKALKEDAYQHGRHCAWLILRQIALYFSSDTNPAQPRRIGEGLAFVRGLLEVFGRTLSAETLRLINGPGRRSKGFAASLREAIHADLYDGSAGALRETMKPARYEERPEDAFHLSRWRAMK